MASYNYSGATKWATKERQRFRRAWRDNHKDFRAIQKIVSSSSESAQMVKMAVKRLRVPHN